MDSNILEMLLKLMSGSVNTTTNYQPPPFQQENTFVSNYPQDNFSAQQHYQTNNYTQNQNSFQSQNNLLPLLLSMLNKNSTASTSSTDNKNENKKAEVTSAPNDEILL